MGDPRGSFLEEINLSPNESFKKTCPFHPMSNLVARFILKILKIKTMFRSPISSNQYGQYALPSPIVAQVGIYRRLDGVTVVPPRNPQVLPEASVLPYMDTVDV